MHRALCHAPRIQLTVDVIGRRHSLTVPKKRIMKDLRVSEGGLGGFCGTEAHRSVKHKALPATNW